MASEGQPHEDQDMLLARVLQEQEQAFHEMLMASMAQADRACAAVADGGVSTGSGSEEEALDDEELARRLQSQEDEELYAGHGFGGAGFNIDVDYDRLSYEDYNALGDVAGAVSKGLAADVLETLPRVLASHHLQRNCSCAARQNQQQQQQQQAASAAGSQDAAGGCTCLQAASTMCVVCQCDFAEEEELTVLPCSHPYHPACIGAWLASNKTCPMCHAEVKLDGKQGAAAAAGGAAAKAGAAVPPAAAGTTAAAAAQKDRRGSLT